MINKNLDGFIAAVEATKDMKPEQTVNPVQEDFMRQYQLGEVERERIVNAFILFLYSTTKAMLASRANWLPNRSGTLLTRVIPTDETTQIGIIKGTFVRKSGELWDGVPYATVYDWTPDLRLVIRGLLDPLWGGLVALRDYGFKETPRFDPQRPEEPDTSLYDLSKPLVLEMVAKLQVMMPWGASPYGEDNAAYQEVLKFLQSFPVFLMTAATDPMRFEGIASALRDIEGMCYRRMND